MIFKFYTDSNEVGVNLSNMSNPIHSSPIEEQKPIIPVINPK